jgi:hypothetical protein
MRKRRVAAPNIEDNEILGWILMGGALSLIVA